MGHDNLTPAYSGMYAGWYCERRLYMDDGPERHVGCYSISDVDAWESYLRNGHIVVRRAQITHVTDHVTYQQTKVYGIRLRKVPVSGSLRVLTGTKTGTLRQFYTDEDDPRIAWMHWLRYGDELDAFYTPESFEDRVRRSHMHDTTTMEL